MALLCSQLPSGPQSWQRRLEEQCKQWLLQSPASWCARPQRQRKHLGPAGDTSAEQLLVALRAARGAQRRKKKERRRLSNAAASPPIVAEGCVPVPGRGDALGPAAPSAVVAPPAVDVDSLMAEPAVDVIAKAVVTASRTSWVHSTESRRVAPAASRASSRRASSTSSGASAVADMRLALGLSPRAGSVGRTPFGRGSDLDDESAPPVGAAEASALTEAEVAGYTTAASFPDCSIPAAADDNPRGVL